MENEEVLDTQDEIQQDIEPVEKSMDDTIRETLEKINSRDLEGEETVADRSRDERGRFAKSAEQAQEPAPVEQAEPVEAQAAPTVPPELQRLGLKKEEAEAIASNPVALQAFVRRSEEMHKGLEQYREKANFGLQIEQELTPYAATLKALGVPPAQAVREMLATDHRLRYGSDNQRYQAWLQLGQHYGLNAENIPQHAEPQYVDPQVSALQSQLQQMQGWIQQQNQAREWQERETLNSEITRFSSDPSHTYFEEVRSDMAGLLQAGLASSLEEAYEKALYANPAIRSKVLAEQQAKAEEQRKAEALQKAQAAKQAAAVNVPRKGTLTAAKPIGSMDDTIRETAQRLGIL